MTAPFSLFGCVNEIDNDLCRFFNTDCSGIEADVKVGCVAPGAAGVVLIIELAALILFGKPHFRTLFGFAVETNDAVGTKSGICMDVNMECIGTVFENIVGVAAYDDTGSIVRDLQNAAALNVP